MTDGDAWGWATDARLPLLCLTFTKRLASYEVLHRYGADPGTARVLTPGETSGLRELALRGGTVLRAGTVGGWSFCYEDVGGAGSRPGPLGALSNGTETLSLLRGGDGMNRMAYWRDGQCLEDFEPGAADRLPRGERHFWDLVHSAGQTAPHRPGLLLALRAITCHTGVSLGTDTVEGPLLTAYLADEDRTPDPAPRHRPAAPGNGTSGLGRLLGAVQPSPPSNQPRGRR